MSRKSKFDLNELISNIELMKKQGKSNRCIAKELSISEGYIRKLMRTNNIQKDTDKEKLNRDFNALTTDSVKISNDSQKGTELNEHNKQIIINMHNKGKSEKEISEHYGLDQNEVNMIILKYDLSCITNGKAY